MPVEARRMTRWASIVSGFAVAVLPLVLPAAPVRAALTAAPARASQMTAPSPAPDGPGEPRLTVPPSEVGSGPSPTGPVTGVTPTDAASLTRATPGTAPATPGSAPATPSPPSARSPSSSTTGPAESTTGPAESTTGPAESSPPAVRPATPAAGFSGDVPLHTVMTALAVLLLSGLLLFRVTKRHPDSSGWRGPSPTPAAESGTEALLLMAAAGEALIDSGYDTISVRTALQDIARVNGLLSVEIIALPTALFVSVQTGGTVRTGAVATGSHRLRLHQIEEVDEVVGRARRGQTSPQTARQKIVEIRHAPAPFNPWQQLLGQALTATALAVLLGGSWIGVAVAAGLGAMVGRLMLTGEAVQEQYRVLLTVAASFGVSLVVFLLTRAGLDIGVLPTVVAPLVTLLPGALLTTGILELSTGQMLAGAGRLAAGVMQLVLLALGIVGAAALVGVPASDLTEAREPLGAVAPWVAVAAFGVGVVLSQCARPSSLGWILLVVYVAYGAQILGDVLFGGVLSAFVGAVVMAPVAVIVSRQRSGPPAVVSFMPAFWLLVPGALGLVGITTVLDGDTYGLRTLITMMTTMVAIALGVLVGLGLAAAGQGRSARSRDTRPSTRGGSPRSP